MGEWGGGSGLDGELGGRRGWWGRRVRGGSWWSGEEEVDRMGSGGDGGWLGTGWWIRLRSGCGWGGRRDDVSAAALVLFQDSLPYFSVLCCLSV